MKKEITHGTSSGYQWYKCRCELCKKANADRKRPQVARDSHKYKKDPADSTILAVSIISPPYWVFSGGKLVGGTCMD